MKKHIIAIALLFTGLAGNSMQAAAATPPMVTVVVFEGGKLQSNMIQVPSQTTPLEVAQIFRSPRSLDERTLAVIHKTKGISTTYSYGDENNHLMIPITVAPGDEFAIGRSQTLVAQRAAGVPPAAGVGSAHAAALAGAAGAGASAPAGASASGTIRIDLDGNRFDSGDFVEVAQGASMEDIMHAIAKHSKWDQSKTIHNMELAIRGVTTRYSFKNKNTKDTPTFTSSPWITVNIIEAPGFSKRQQIGGTLTLVALTAAAGTYMTRRVYQNRKKHLVKKYGIGNLTRLQDKVWLATLSARFGVTRFLNGLVRSNPDASLTDFTGSNPRALAEFYFGKAPTDAQLNQFIKRFFPGR